MKTPLMENVIRLFDLKPHPEGGFFRETYRSPQLIPVEALPARFKGAKGRSVATSIYYLLPPGSKSHIHRLAADELWHFYLGGPMKLVVISPEGGAGEVTLGRDIENGQRLQHVVPAGCWFGGYPAGEEYSLVGCDVVPGFDLSDFEMGDRVKLTREFPDLRSLIENLTAD